MDRSLQTHQEEKPSMPSVMEISDWRRSIADLYSKVRAATDPVCGWNLWCERRESLFKTHPASPTAAGSKSPPRVYPYDPRWRFEVQVTEAEQQKLFDVDTGFEGVARMQQRLRTQGLSKHIGRELAIYWLTGYGGGLFLPYRDAISNGETYDGGRYILDTIKGADLGTSGGGNLIIDFNFSFNPSCAFSDQWICPLAPPANQLDLEVKAGEKIPI